MTLSSRTTSQNSIAAGIEINFEFAVLSLSSFFFREQIQKFCQLSLARILCRHSRLITALCDPDSHRVTGTADFPMPRLGGRNSSER